MSLIGYHVTMFLWVECTDARHTLVQPEQYTYTVQPPVWTQGDDVSLEMWLDLLVKQKFLVELHKRAKVEPAIARIMDSNQFMVRGMMESWVGPANHEGKRRSKTFAPDRLRCA